MWNYLVRYYYNKRHSCNQESSEKLVSALSWGFHYTEHKHILFESSEPKANFEKLVTNVLKMADVIVLSSGLKSEEALNKVKNEIIRRRIDKVFIINDGGSKERECCKELKRSLERHCLCVIREKYTPLISLADYLASLACCYVHWLRIKEFAKPEVRFMVRLFESLLHNRELRSKIKCIF